MTEEFFGTRAAYPIRSGVRGSEVGLLLPRLIPNPLRVELVTAIAMRGDSRILFFFPPLSAANPDESKRKLTQLGLSIASIVPYYRLQFRRFYPFRTRLSVFVDTGLCIIINLPVINIGNIAIAIICDYNCGVE